MARLPAAARIKHTHAHSHRERRYNFQYLAHTHKVGVAVGGNNAASVKIGKIVAVSLPLTKIKGVAFEWISVCMRVCACVFMHRRAGRGILCTCTIIFCLPTCGMYVIFTLLLLYGQLPNTSIIIIQKKKFKFQ